MGAVAAQKKPSQIRHLPAHERKQFWVAHPLTSDGESLSKIGG